MECYSMCAVIVTYNRVEKLKLCFKAYDDQILKPQEIIVVNNNSSDGTEQFLQEWQRRDADYKKTVITCSVNNGGSGGFYIGLERAIQTTAAWVIVGDDDAYPDKETIKIIADTIENLGTTGKSDCVALCTSVINSGQIDLAHRRNTFAKGLLIYDRSVPASEYEKDIFELNAFSYVGTVMKTETLKKVGLTRKEFFIYYDDTEHSLRLSKQGSILCIPKAKVYHDAISDANVNWKTYYGIRNQLVVFKAYFGKPWLLCVGVQILKALLQPIKGRGPRVIKMRMQAIYDAIVGNLGMHSVYKPGWKP